MDQKYGQSMFQLVPLLQAHSSNQGVSRAVFLLGGSGEDPASKIVQVVVIILFLGVAGLRYLLLAHCQSTLPLTSVAICLAF